MKTGGHGDDNIRGGRKHITVKAKNLTHYPFNPISPYSAANKPVHADAKATFSPAVGHINERKTWPFAPSSLPVYLLKLPRFPQKVLLGESEMLHKIRLTDVFCPWPAGS